MVQLDNSRKNMRYQFRFLAAVLLSIGFMAASAHADIVDVNGGCSVGPCGNSTPVSITDGNAVGPVPFNFAYTAGGTGDVYNISGTYAASYIGGITSFAVDLSAAYTGNNGATAAADTFTVDVFQNIFDPSCCTWAGDYTENVPVSFSTGLGGGSATTVNFLWDGVGIGPLNFTSSGFQSQTTTLGNPNFPYDPVFTQPLLTADAKAEFVFGAGTTQGGTIGINSPTPEPVELLPVAGLMLGLVWLRMRRKNAPTAVDSKA